MKTGFTRGASSIAITAALSLAVLLAAFGIQLGERAQTHASVASLPLEPIDAPSYVAIEDRDGNGTPDWQDELTKSGILAQSSSTSEATTTDALSYIAENVAQSLYSGYLSLKQYNQYTPERGERLAATAAANITVPTNFVRHTADELSLDSDTSEKRILRYRSDMRDATAPMVTDDEPEFELFAQYLQTKDPSWLEKIAQAAARYRTVEKNMLALKIPKDAAPEHLRALNALGAYADVLDQLAQPHDDGFATAALVKAQNEGEQETLLSFDALAKYYVRTIAQK